MKNQKIEDFISKLVDPNLPEEQQSYILTSDEIADSAGDNTGDSCSNSSASSCGGKNSNGNCTNYRVCAGATNYGTCKNLDPVVVDASCVTPENPSGNCG